MDKLIISGVLIPVGCLVAYTYIATFSSGSSKLETLNKGLNEVINKKIDICISSEEYEDVGLTYITGAAVINEILSQDGTKTIIVDNVTINNIRTENNILLFEALKKGENPGKALSDKVGLKRNYVKEYMVDANGTLYGVRYTSRN